MKPQHALATLKGYACARPAKLKAGREAAKGRRALVAGLIMHHSYINGAFHSTKFLSNRAEEDQKIFE